MRYVQPQNGPFQLDWGNPLTRALSFAWTPSAGDRDIVSGTAAVREGATPSPRIVYGSRVGTKYVGGANLSFGSLTGANFGGASNQTVFVDAFIPDVVNCGGYFLGRIQSNWDYGMSIDSSAGQIFFGTGGQSGSTSVACPPTSVFQGLLPYQGRPLAICGTYDKINARMYVDGQQKGSAALTTSFPVDSDAFAIGSRGGGNQTGSQASGVYMALVLIFKRTLSPTEVKSLSDNPWQIFKSPQRVMGRTAGAVSYSLTASAGSFGIVGNPAGLRTNRKLIAAAASFALAGSAATLALNRRLPTATASFVVAGPAVGLRAGRFMLGATGIFSITGNALALRLARRMAIALGSYLLTGTSTRLAAQHRLAAVAGAFSMTGNAGSLVYGQIHPAGAALAAVPCVFAVTGNAASLRAARQLTAASTSYALTGNVAGLIRGRRLVVAPGAIVITGGAVVFRVAYRLAASTGAFALAGVDVNLVYSAVVRYARAPAGAGYAPQSEQQQHRPTDCAQARPADIQRNHR